MTAAAVLYVRDLPAMRTFYERCFGLARLGLSEDEFCVLATACGELSLVSIPERVAATFELTVPPQRRESSPVKLAFDIASIDAVRPIVTAAGGRVDPADSAWEFRDWRHVDCVDPEGNVVQLREPLGS